MRPVLALLVAALALAACGGAAAPAPAPAPTAATAATTAAAPEAPAADVFPAEGEARATVVLFHGWTDLAPEDGYLPWIRHLNGEGVAVVFPRYQRGLLSTPGEMLADAEAATRTGLDELGGSAPVIAAGYSLGGGYAVVYAANAAAWDAPQPVAVYGVFPAMPPEVPEPFGAVPAATSVRLVAGDADAVVGLEGADRLAAAIAPHPAQIDVLASTAAIRFDHLAPKRADAAARRAFWAPLDRLVDRVAPR